MDDLFAPPKLTRQDFGSKRLTVVPVPGSAMEPTLKGGWDYVLAAPTKVFLYDSLYVIDDSATVPLIYRVQKKLGGGVLLIKDNERYGRDAVEVPMAWFEEHVLGIVVCDLKVRDPEMLREAWEQAQ
jgi:signal peptidase I